MKREWKRTRLKETHGFRFPSLTIQYNCNTLEILQIGNNGVEAYLCETNKTQFPEFRMNELQKIKIGIRRGDEFVQTAEGDGREIRGSGEEMWVNV